MATRKNLVLGGGGTIGKALVSYLQKIGEEAISLDLKEGFDITKDDLTAYKHVDYVWFLAWEVGGAKYLSNEKYLMDIIKKNTIICEKVFQFLEDSKLPFMFASSQLAAADTPYGVTKLLGEEWTRILNGQICRFWNVYGWEEPGEKSHVIPDLIIQALTKQKIELLTDGQEQRQFIFMDDCVENMVAIRDAGATRVDITNHNWVTIEYVASQIAALHKVPVKLGSKKGYSNKIEAHSNYPLVFKTDLKRGIEILTEKAKEYLAKNK